ncbi:hypothetical protein C0J52_06387 [Blattella germanica]|nr:hypothetical protein C0J52_06387 [Blattella germanica]
MNVKETSGNLKKELRNDITESVSTLRKIFINFKNQIVEQKSEIVVLEQELSKAKADLAACNVSGPTARGGREASWQGTPRTAPRQVLPSTASEKKTYSEVCAGIPVGKRFKLTVKSKQNQNPEVVKKLLKQKISPTEMKIGISTFKTLKDGRILIEASTKEEISLLSADINAKCGEELAVQVPQLRNPRLIIFNTPEDFSVEGAEETIIAQNPELELQKGDIIPKFRIKTKRGNYSLIIENMFTNGTRNSKYLIPLMSSISFDTRPTGTSASISQVDLQLAIETEQIVDILNQTIKQIELAMCLPQLIENEAEFLYSCLTRDELTLVTKSCAPYTEKLSLKGREENKFIGFSGDIFNKCMPYISYEQREDVNMCRAIKMLYSKPVIMDKVTELLPQISPAAEAFIKYLKRLQAFGKEHLSMSPLQQLDKEEELHRIWNDNEVAKQEISKIVKYLEEQNNELQLKMMAKNLMINQHEGKIERLNKNYESERRMVLDCEESELHHRYLTSEIQYLDERMKSLLEVNLLEEKTLRDKRFLLLIQYHQKVQFAIQESEYKRLMKEKADGEKAILEKKLLAFIYTRSARKIQRYWRAYRARKLSRKKGRKKKKGSGKNK